MTGNPMFSANYEISFGDCDPAGIVFYPNIFAWLDRTFHSFLRARAQGHAAICKSLDLKGVGVTSAHCGFRAPVKEGDKLIVSIDTIEWNDRGFDVSYLGRIETRTVFEGLEKRALFKLVEGRMRSGDPAGLRTHLGLSASSQSRSEGSSNYQATI